MRTILVFGFALLFGTTPLLAQEFSGNGQQATNFVQLPAGVALVELEHEGDGDFLVRLIDGRGLPVQVLADMQGAGQLARAVRIPAAGAYLFDVVASGSWAIRLQNDAAAFRNVDLIDIGRADGRVAARQRAGARWMGIGFAGGLVLGPLGAGGAYLAAGGRSTGEPTLPADGAALGPVYRDAFTGAYEDAIRGERRTAALVGGIVGAAANAVLLLHFARDRGGMDDDGLPGPPQLYRGRTPLLMVSIPTR